jgi:transposase
MFLRCSARKKDGKEHHYWSLVENRRVAEGRVVQRHVLYLGEINDEQQAAWRRSIEIFDQGEKMARTVALVAAERQIEQDDQAIVRIRVDEMELRRPRQWGGCWLACELYHQLELDQFFSQRLAPSRKGTRWDLILQTLVCYRLLDPGSEWRLHRQWFVSSAMADLLGSDFSLAESHKLYRVHELLLAHKAELFSHLQQRWKDLFGARFEVLLYDLTSTYFESDADFDPEDKRRFGYSRDKRNDCVQVVIALVVTPEGFPIAYEVLAGNTADKTTLRAFLQKIEAQYGKADRIWVMDRGVPTEEVLAEMRESDPAICYLVGTPKGRLSKLEAQLLEQPWKDVRPGLEIKLLAQEKELYILAQSRQRLSKERAIRRRRLKRLWQRLGQLRQMRLSRDELLIKLGQAKAEAGRSVWKLVQISVAQAENSPSPLLSYRLNKERLRVVRRREGRYLLRSNLLGIEPARLWELYIQLTQIEEAFRNLKGDLAIRPIYHQLEQRIEAHIFVAFIAYCLHVTLRRRLHRLAPGLTPRAVLEKFKTIQMIDVHLPTTDGRTVILPRYTQPEREHRMLLHGLNLELPVQPKPRITAAGKLAD